MLTILIHSSKTMTNGARVHGAYQQPHLIQNANQLAHFMRSLSVSDIKSIMKLSDPMAIKTQTLFSQWNTQPDSQTPAIDAFLGDIYSGLQAHTFTEADREYANKHLYILSGLYGVLRALDCISPYRLEMGYKFPNTPYANLYSYWSDTIAGQLPQHTPIVNLSSDEYMKALLPHLQNTTVVSPRFLTLDASTNTPKFVVVHAKIARGAFTKWLIKNRISNIDDLKGFSDLDYKYDTSLSTSQQPVFVCKQFQGIGLSVRLSER